jgi:DNA-binding XRE family transcriptional regulator
VSEALHNVTESTWKWTPQREKAALAVAESATIIDAAKVVDVTRKTIYEWLKSPEFRARVDEHLDEVVSAARQILRRNAVAAAQQLVNIHAHGHPLHSVKLAASKDILDRVGLKAPEKIELAGTIGTYIVDLGVSSGDGSTG